MTKACSSAPIGSPVRPSPRPRPAHPRDPGRLPLDARRHHRPARPRPVGRSLPGRRRRSRCVGGLVLAGGALRLRARPRARPLGRRPPRGRRGRRHHPVDARRHRPAPQQPESPGAAFRIAIAGPLVSFGLAVGFAVVAAATGGRCAAGRGRRLARVAGVRERRPRRLQPHSRRAARRWAHPRRRALGAPRRPVAGRRRPRRRPVGSWAGASSAFGAAGARGRQRLRRAVADAPRAGS